MDTRIFGVTNKCAGLTVGVMGVFLFLLYMSRDQKETLSNPTELGM